MFTICTVGCGWMSSTGHGPSLKKYSDDREGVVLAGCCDLDEGRAIEYKEKFGFKKHYTDMKTMIAECKPDVVSVIMPVNLTAKVATEIMKLGCNVIMEKPPGKNIDETNALVATAREMGVSARVSFNRRYFPLITETMKRIKETGEKVDSVTCQMYRFNRPDADFSTTIVHVIDAVKYIVGSDFVSAKMEYTPMPELGEGVKDIFMTCRFENGSVAQIIAAPNSGSVTERFTVNTRNHTYFIDLPVCGNLDTPGKLVIQHEGKENEVVNGRSLIDTEEMFEMSGFYGANASYFDLLREGKKIIDLDTAIDCVKLQDAVRDNITEWHR
ncbi:MAG: Gfo/Idh/MocA family oxidoreductase [Ruminococcaceae bacterium]|nr:Gfo/Idh/MocA family oxidoreductase [Oscillospiraceae bacterium]